MLPPAGRGEAGRAADRGWGGRAATGSRLVQPLPRSLSLSSNSRLCYTLCTSAARRSPQLWIDSPRSVTLNLRLWDAHERQLSAGTVPPPFEVTFTAVHASGGDDWSTSAQLGAAVLCLASVGLPACLPACEPAGWLQPAGLSACSL